VSLPAFAGAIVCAVLLALGLAALLARRDGRIAGLAMVLEAGVLAAVVLTRASGTGASRAEAWAFVAGLLLLAGTTIGTLLATADPGEAEEP
jgi:hypothetical protein